MMEHSYTSEIMEISAKLVIGFIDKMHHLKEEEILHKIPFDLFYN